jgi:hypothetical protein
MTTPPTFQPLRFHKLTSTKATKRQCLNICYHCDEIFFKGHKCKEHKLFVIDMALLGMPNFKGSHIQDGYSRDYTSPHKDATHEPPYE